MGADYDLQASGWKKGVLAGLAKGMKNGKVRLSQEQLTMLIGGIELKPNSTQSIAYWKEIVEIGAEKPGGLNTEFLP